MTSNENFENVLSGQFGQAEAALGSTLYEANTKVAESFAGLNSARALLMNGFAFFMYLAAFAALPPLAVFLWRWALSS